MPTYIIIYHPYLNDFEILRSLDPYKKETGKFREKKISWSIFCNLKHKPLYEIMLRVENILEVYRNSSTKNQTPGFTFQKVTTLFSGWWNVVKSCFSCDEYRQMSWVSLKKAAVQETGARLFLFSLKDISTPQPSTVFSLSGYSLNFRARLSSLSPPSFMP